MVPPTVRMPESAAWSSGIGAVLHQAAKTVAEADHLHAENALGGLADAANGGVEAGAIAAGSEDADGFCHCFPFCFFSAAMTWSRCPPKARGFSL